MPKFVAYSRNILSDYGIKSESIEVDCGTVIEAAMAFFAKHGKMPDEVYSESDRNQQMREFESLKSMLWEAQKQRDNFARSLDAAVGERTIAVDYINKLHDLAQQVLAACNMTVEVKRV